MKILVDALGKESVSRDLGSVIGGSRIFIKSGSGGIVEDHFKYSRCIFLLREFFNNTFIFLLILVSFTIKDDTVTYQN